MLKVCDVFSALKGVDHALAEVIADLNPKDAQFTNRLTSAVSQSSFSKISPQHMIGVMMVTSLMLIPGISAKLSIFLKVLYDDKALSEEAIREWYAADAETTMTFLPSGHKLTVESITKAKASCRIFIEWLDSEEEEDEEDDDEEEED